MENFTEILKEEEEKKENDEIVIIDEKDNKIQKNTWIEEIYIKSWKHKKKQGEKGLYLKELLNKFIDPGKINFNNNKNKKRESKMVLFE
jgi:hypothetical protein